MARRSKILAPKNIIKVVGLTALVIGVYMFNSVLIALLTDPNAGKYDRSQQGSETDPWDDVTLHSITFDPSAYIAALLNSDLFAELSLEEQMALLQDLLGDGIVDYLDDTNLSPEEFLDLYNEELAGLLEALSGDSFSGDFLDNFNDPALVVVLLAKPMFYAAGSNPSNPWTDQQDTLFKTKSFRRYNLTTFEWKEGSLGVDGNLVTETNTADKKFHIKAPVIMGQETVATLYSNSPRPRVLRDSIAFTPITPSTAPALKSQSYLGGAWAQMTFGAEYLTKTTNMSFDLLYNNADYPGMTYYDGLGLDMADFIGTIQAVSTCLNGPYNGVSNIAWTTFRVNNPYFATVASELASYPAFTTATSTYAQMQAIVNYIGENFVYNPYGTSRPAAGVEPIEWFSQSRESQYPFEFSSLAVALARLNGISSRYVTGYKSNELLDSLLGVNSFYDSVDGFTYYPYLLGNIQTWVETFIPTSSTGGVWVAFDMEFMEPVIPSLEDVTINLQYNDGSYLPNLAGYERFILNVAQTVDIKVTCKNAGIPMANQLITLNDITYNDVLAWGSTNLNGQITFTLKLDEITAGAHVLNVTTNYFIPLNNITVINVLDDIEIVTNFDNTYNIFSPDTPPSQLVSGYALDVYTEDHVANVELNFTGVKLATENEPIPTAFAVNPSSVITSQTGDFSFYTSIPAYIALDWGSKYTISTSFNGINDISADIAKFNPIFQTFFDFLPTTRIAALLNAGYTDVKDTSFWMYNNQYYDYEFYLNTTRYALNTTVATYDDPVLYGTRANLVFNFTAVLWQGYSYSASAQIRIFDVSEGNRLVKTLTTNINGYASSNHIIAGDSATYWTAGPHLLRMVWVGAPNVAETYFYVVIREPVVVDQTSEFFTGGTGGSPNIYYLNNGFDPYDSFTMTGNMRDSGTAENLKNYIIHYRVIDKNGVAWNDSFLQNGVFYENVIDAVVGYSETFNFFNISSVSLSPFRTDAYFLGIFYGASGSGWNNSWNTLWMPYYQALPTTNDSSDGTIVVIASVSYEFNPKLNDVAISIINATIPIPNRVYGESESLNFSCLFLNDSLPLAGANITLYNVNTTESLHTTTDAFGKASFIVNFGPGNPPGINKFLFSSSFDNGIYVAINQTYIELIFDELKDYNYHMDITDDFTGPYSHYGAGDTLQLDSQFLSDITPIPGAIINITDSQGLLHSDVTDANGWVNFTVEFGEGWIPGWHTITVEVYYDEGSHIYTNSFEYILYFNHTMNYGFVPYDDIGGVTQTFGDSIEISGAFYRNGAAQSGANVTLTDLTNGTTWSKLTLANGNVNFTINFNADVYLGIHHYQMALTYDGITYTITGLSDHWVFYQNTLTLSAEIVGYTTNMTLDQSTPFAISVQGYLVDSSNAAHGHLNALLSVYIYNGSTDVSDLLSYSYVVNFYNDNTNGAYDITVSITTAPQQGQYTIVVGFNGSLDTTEYSSYAIPINSTDTEYFWVYQNSFIDYSYIIDNSGLPYPLNNTSGLVIGGSDVTISGNLTDSEGIPIAGETITIVLYNPQNQSVYTTSFVTLADGSFIFLFENCEYNIEYFILSFDGNDTTYVNPADDTGGQI